MARFILALLITISSITTSYGWSGNKHITLTCSWSSRNLGGCGEGRMEFDYNSKDRPYISMTKPSSAKDGVEMIPHQWISLKDGSAVRFEGSLTNGYLSPRVGADTDNDLDGLHSGKFYTWYGDNGILYEYEYTNFYSPIAEVSLNSSIIELGTCIKSSVNTGHILEKVVNVPITLRGYTPNPRYSLSRVIRSANSPEAVSYRDRDQKMITLGQKSTLVNSLSGTFPKKMDDVINVRLECDKMNAGEYSWALNVEYIIP